MIISDIRKLKMFNNLKDQYDLRVVKYKFNGKIYSIGCDIELKNATIEIEPVFYSKLEYKIVIRSHCNLELLIISPTYYNGRLLKKSITEIIEKINSI
jgi:hypothetical protein